VCRVSGSTTLCGMHHKVLNMHVRMHTYMRVSERWRIHAYVPDVD